MIANGESSFISMTKDGPETIVFDRDDYEELYERCWGLEDNSYRINSPGEKVVGTFLECAEPYATQTLIDWGCGTGRAGYKLYKENDLNVTLVDFAGNCLDKNIAEECIDNENLRFVKHDLSEPIDPEKISVPSEFGYCADVLEHIPESSIDLVLENILENSRHVFFQISCQEDHFGMHDEIRGDKTRERLHVCVHPYLWWLQKFVDHGVIVHRSSDFIRSCLFYVSGYQTQNLDLIEGHVNVPTDVILDNIRYSSTLGIPAVGPMETQDIEIMLLAGGPSLNDFQEEIIQQRKDGMKLVTVNGAYNWAQELGLEPSLQFLLDARGFNKRFVEQSELTEKTKFVISSSADPEVFDLVPHDRTFVFHTSVTDEMVPVLEECYGPMYEKDGVFPVPGGCTVTLRAIAGLRMLGFYKIHIYGWDGCIMNDLHHAYKQDENESDVLDAVKLTVARGSAYEKEFTVAPWHVAQAMDFKKMAVKILPDVQLNVRGDGLIAYMIETAAKLVDDAGVDVELDTEETPGKRVYVDKRAHSTKDGTLYGY
jgi:hypothetical protein